MAGSSMTFQYDDVGTVKKIIIDWVSDDVTLGVDGETKKISGLLLKGVTDPDGVAAPANLYDIILQDEEVGNILDNCNDDLLDRSNVNVETVDFLIRYYEGGQGDPCGSDERPCASDKITVGVANCGAGNNEGRLVLYWMGSV